MKELYHETIEISPQLEENSINKENRFGMNITEINYFQKKPRGKVL